MIRHSAHVARQLAKSCTGPYWVVAYELRMKSYQKRRSSLVSDYLARPGKKKLQIGCGKVACIDRAT